MGDFEMVEIHLLIALAFTLFGIFIFNKRIHDIVLRCNKQVTFSSLKYNSGVVMLQHFG